MTLQARLRKRLAAFELDVDVEAAPGVTIVLGRSGAGKSTILRCIAGLDDPDSGRVAVGGQVLFDSERRVGVDPSRRRVAFVVQDLALFPHLSVEGNVMYGLRRIAREERRPRAREVLEAFDIAHLASRSPREISGGEQQRVALARALVTEPAALLLDEPLSSLDPTTKAGIIDDLQRWNDTRRIPIVYVTHDRGELQALGDRVMVLDRGRIVEQGTPMEVALGPAPAAAAHRAGFENVFDATVLERHDDDHTMVCRVAGTEIVLLAPSAPVPVGSEVSLGVRAGAILLSSTRPAMLSPCNVLPGTIRQVERRGPAVDVRVAGGAELRARMDARTAAARGVAVAQEVWMLFAAQACQVVRPVSLDALRRLFVFVCHGNTVRSPMAQAICNAEIAARLGVPVDAAGIMAMSAGLKARPGEPLDDQAGQALGALGMAVPDHRSNNLTHRLAEKAEAIFCMTEAQRTELVTRFPAAEPKTHRLDPEGNVGNPHGQPDDGFLECARILEDLVRRRLTTLGVTSDQDGH